MTGSTGFIEVDMFSEDIDGEQHPDVVRFKQVLEAVAEDYACRLTHFEVNGGTVTFSFDDDTLMAEILRILQGPSADQ
jgi:hypothetical protein